MEKPSKKIWNKLTKYQKDLWEILRQKLQKLLYETYKDMQCPVCGYYCLGKGGVGCINKPMFCGLDNDTQNKRSK